MHTGWVQAKLSLLCCLLLTDPASRKGGPALPPFDRWGKWKGTWLAQDNAADHWYSQDCNLGLVPGLGLQMRHHLLLL